MLAAVLGLHLAWLQCFRSSVGSGIYTGTPYRSGSSNVAFTVELAPRPSGFAPQEKNSFAAKAVPKYSGDSNPERNSQDFRQSQYRGSDHLDTRAAPSLLIWNIDKQLIHCGKPASLVFTVWVSAAGTIDALEPHTCNGQPWAYDDMAKALQATSMVPASLRTQPVASTMTVELMVDNDD